METPTTKSVPFAATFRSVPPQPFSLHRTSTRGTARNSGQQSNPSTSNHFLPFSPATQSALEGPSYSTHDTTILYSAITELTKSIHVLSSSSDSNNRINQIMANHDHFSHMFTFLQQRQINTLCTDYSTGITLFKVLITTVVKKKTTAEFDV